MKKLFTIMLTIAMILTSVFTTACTPEDKASGTQGSKNDSTNNSPQEKYTENLRYVVLDDGTYGVGISEETKELADIVVPATFNGKPVTQVLDAGFANATEIKTVKLPDTITAIGGNAFKSCYSLESINIPDSVTEIGGGAFMQCTKLKSIVLPDSILYVQARTFRESGIESITLSKSLTSISAEAFYNCWNLKSITIPEGVIKINDKAFCQCTAMVEVYLPISLTSVEILSFDCCYELKSMYYPGSKEDFAKIENSKFIRYGTTHYNYAPENNG